MRFIESPIFTASLRRHLESDAYRAMQAALALQPTEGVLIPDGTACASCDGGAKGRGKRGGARTIYYWAVADVVCCMLYVYAKNEQGDLTPVPLRALTRVVRGEFK